jgi:hypothetical protein
VSFHLLYLRSTVFDAVHLHSTRPQQPHVSYFRLKAIQLCNLVAREHLTVIHFGFSLRLC